jgi:DNA-binding PadR family transcriptional regulator
VHATLACLLNFRLYAEGFTSADLRDRLVETLARPDLSPGQMSYHLRRLRLHGLIKRRPGRNQYRLTDTGLQAAVAYTLAHDRILRPGTAHISDPDLPSELRRAYAKFAQQSCLAA